MKDPTDFEKACMEKVIYPLAECVAEIGTHKSFDDLTKEQVLTLIEVIVTAYMEALSKGSEEIPF